MSRTPKPKRVAREPLFRLMFKLRSMPVGDQCAYLIACIKAEAPDTSRRRELQRLLIDTRTQQIRNEIGTKRVRRTRNGLS